MIDLYTWSTPNGRKVSIALEELALDYNPISIDIGNGEQHTEAFSAISPNHKIPAIVDHDTGIQLMESGAILIYLAEKTGKLLTTDTFKRYQTLEWLMWQMGGVGPMFGQVHHFVKHNSGKSEYAEQRYANEARRLYAVLDQRLQDREFMIDDYSIADIATWPWVSRFEWQQVDLHEYPNVLRWYVNIANRPAVQRGYVVGGNGAELPLP
jgi:GSH-dependent disulfide-bond oxidoreductase